MFVYFAQSCFEIEEPAEELSVESEDLTFDETVSEEELIADETVEEPFEPAAVEEDTGFDAIPSSLRSELKSVLSYMDQLLESLPEDKIQEFARSEHFEVYKKLFEELELNA